MKKTYVFHRCSKFYVYSLSFMLIDNVFDDNKTRNMIEEVDETKAIIDIPEQSDDEYQQLPAITKLAGGDSDDEEEEDEALKRTGKPFGGLILDIKRKKPWFLSDFKDALAPQTVASIIYIYLATVTKAITFGGFLGDITGGQQGVLEAFLGHALAGGFFCLLGGQPLTVVGCTGPVLIFEEILVNMCKAQNIDYMTFRLWIGLW